VSNFKAVVVFGGWSLFGIAKGNSHFGRPLATHEGQGSACKYLRMSVMRIAEISAYFRKMAVDVRPTPR